MLLFPLQIVLLRLIFASASNPIVHTNYGPVQGFQLETERGTKANIFLGIPFAKPPIGELRFETSKPYAVIVWIHSGGFNVGSAAIYSFSTITDNFVSRDVIYVTIQYRLGFLGFMSSGDKEMPGNNGLWDQAAALQFIKENIEYFGGDAERITVQGLSAGGASVSALQLSPHSQHLFSGSIEMSGTIYASWASSTKVDSESLKLAMYVQCPTLNSESLKQCLKAKSVDELLTASEKMDNGEISDNILRFTTRMDNDFFPNDLEVLLANAPKKPSIIGVTEKEGILFTLFPIDGAVSTLYIRPEHFEKFTKADFVNFIKKWVQSKKELGNHTNEIIDRIIDYYVNQAELDDLDYKVWLRQYTMLISDISAHLAARKEAELKLQYGWPVWFYVTDYYNPVMYPDDFPCKGNSSCFK